MISTLLLPDRAITLSAREEDVCAAAVKAGAAEDLQNYAADWIANDFVIEYERQMAKWRSATRKVVTAFAHAVYKHMETLKKADEQKQFQWDLMMLALSVATAGCMRWIGATIQYKYAPNAISRLDRVFKTDSDAKTYSQTWSKFLGGTAEDIGNVAFENVAKEFAPPPVTLAFTPADIETFRTHLDNTLDAAVNAFLGQLGKLSRSLRESQDFGVTWLRQSKGNKEAAKELIRTKLGALRLDWSWKWPYYGNDPNLRPDVELQQAIERQIWATWIRNMNLRRFADRPTNRLGEPRGGTSISSVIVDRLRAVNVVIAFPPLARVAQLAHAGAAGPDPSVRVWGDANEKRELVALGEWAEGHLKPEIEKAGVRWQRRRMGSLLEMHDP